MTTSNPSSPNPQPQQNQAQGQGTAQQPVAAAQSSPPLPPLQPNNIKELRMWQGRYGQWKRTRPWWPWFLSVNIILILVLSVFYVWAFYQEEYSTFWTCVLLTVIGVFVFTPVNIYFYYTFIYVPVNTAVILVCERNGDVIGIGGQGQTGHRIKPIWYIVESAQDYISLNRRPVGKDETEEYVSKDGVPLKAKYSGNFAPDMARIVDYRKLTPETISQQVEGVQSTIVTTVGHELTLAENQSIQILNQKIQAELDKAGSILPTHLQKDCLLQRWPISDTQLNVEEVRTGTDTKRVQEAAAQAEMLKNVSGNIALPKLPDENSVEYQAYLLEVKEKYKKEGRRLPKNLERAAVLNLMKQQHGILTHKEAFQHAEVIGNQATQTNLNVTGTGNVTPLVPIKQNQGGKRKKGK